MKIDQWHKPQDIWKYYYPECVGSGYTVIIKNKSYATYDPQTEVLYLQFFLKGQPTVEFRLRKQVQHSLKEHFGCEEKTILVVDIQKETNLQSYFIKFEFYGICNLPSNEMMDKLKDIIKKTIEKCSRKFGRI